MLLNDDGAAEHIRARRGQPSSRLVRMGDMKEKNSRKHGPAVSCPFPITCEELHTGTTSGKSAFRIKGTPSGVAVNTAL